MAGVNYKDLLDLIPAHAILRYMSSEPSGEYGSSRPAVLPPWEELGEVYNREGAEAVQAIVARAFYDNTGVELR